MMKALAPFLVAIPDTWKALSALAGAVAFGIAVTVMGMRFGELPAQVEQNRNAHIENASAIKILNAEISEQNRKLDRVLCILTLPENTTTLEAERVCR